MKRITRRNRKVCDEMDREKVMSWLEGLAQPDWHRFHSDTEVQVIAESALAMLKEQENLLKEYEKLSQVCFKIEKYLRIADLSILIDRIEEGNVEVLQDDNRPGSMETTIKIRRI